MECNDAPQKCKSFHYGPAHTIPWTHPECEITKYYKKMCFFKWRILYWWITEYDNQIARITLPPEA